jgi:hypothetical protein
LKMLIWFLTCGLLEPKSERQLFVPLPNSTFIIFKRRSEIRHVDIRSLPPKSPKTRKDADVLFWGDKC